METRTIIRLREIFNVRITCANCAAEYLIPVPVGMKCPTGCASCGMSWENEQLEDVFIESVNALIRQMANLTQPVDEKFKVFNVCLEVAASDQ